MIPTQVPVFRPKDILVNHSQYRVGRKATISGWVRELFLYGTDVEGDMESLSEKDWKDLETAIKAVSIAAGMNKHSSIIFWEDQLTPKQGAKILNKAMQALGYTEIYDA